MVQIKRNRRRIVLIAGAAGFIVLLAGAAAFHLRHYVSFGPPWGPSSVEWQTEVLQQSRRSEQFAGATVFLGDSQMVGLATSNLAPKPENFGIAGDTIDGLLLRLPRYRLTGARLIVVEIGVNNYVTDGFSGFSPKYRRALGMLPRHTPVISVGIFPVKRGVTTRLGLPVGMTQAIRQANREIADACRQYPNCRFLDVSAALSDADGYLQTRYDSGDGLHLSTAGYAVWEKALKPLTSREQQ